MLQIILTWSSPCLKSKAPGPSVVPAAKANPMAAGHVFTTSVPPTFGTETSRLEKSMYTCWYPTFPLSFSVALSNSSAAFLNCLSPIMRVLSNSSELPNEEIVQNCIGMMFHHYMNLREIVETCTLVPGHSTIHFCHCRYCDRNHTEVLCLCRMHQEHLGLHRHNLIDRMQIQIQALAPSSKHS